MTLIGSLVETFAALSILSIGGANATVPEIHRQVVVLHHWMDDATFASLVTIGQTAPGPNVLVVSMIGWQLAGVLGMLAVTGAIVAPSSLLALAIGRGLAHFGEGGVATLLRRALAPVAVGFMLASAVVMARAAYQNVGTLVLVAVVGALVLFTRVSPLWGIAAGAIAGLLGHRLHVFT